MFLGVFDADGMVLISVYSYLDDVARNPDHKPYGIKIVYGLEQSRSKQDLVAKVANFFEAESTIDSETGRATFRANVNTEIGQKVRSLLLKNNPRHPGRYYDFLLSEKILALKNQNIEETKQGLVTLITLAYSNDASLRKKANEKKNKANNENSDNSKREIPIEVYYKAINPSKIELEEGKKTAEIIVNDLLNQKQQLEEQLPEMEFSIDYVRGVHFGDGGFTIVLSVPKSYERLRFYPEWNISGENLAYCQAFKNFFKKGKTNKSGNYERYILSGMKPVESVYYVFENCWLPEYKKKQFEKIKHINSLLLDGYHLERAGAIHIVNMAYRISEKGKRSKSLEELIEDVNSYFNKKKK